MQGTPKELLALGEQISAAGGVKGLHKSYFVAHLPRMAESIRRFGLLAKPLGDVLEIGPFYGYVPFFLRPNSTSYTVLEGDDPAVYPLLPLYKDRDIRCTCVDLFELFGPIHAATHAMRLPDASFDTILCWETMEHFNFNPVKFVRDLHRLLKPGGRVCITVPNHASFQNLVSLVFGRGEREKIEYFYKFENYESNGKKAFYGFHWREYTPPELRHLFADAGFRVTTCQSFTAFQDHGNTSFSRRMARAASRWGTALLPRFGTNVLLVAEK